MENFLADSKDSTRKGGESTESFKNHLKSVSAGDTISLKDALASAPAPDSLVARCGILTLKGIGNLPAGVFYAGKDAFTHPLKTLEIAGSAAVMSAALKTILPESGKVGKVVGLAIGAYFAFDTGKTFVQPYRDAVNAGTMNELDIASAHLGDTGGKYLVNSAIAGVGSSLGAAGADRVLLRPELDGFADLKKSFWDSLSSRAGKITEAIGLAGAEEPARRSGVSSLVPCLTDTLQLAPAQKAAQEGVFKGAVPGNEDIDLTIRLKPGASDLTMDRALKRLELGRARPMTDAEFTAKFGASRESLDAVARFARDNGLTISESDLRSGLVVLGGRADNVASAFHVKLNKYDLNGQEYIKHDGAVTVPDVLASHIENISGLDKTPGARAQDLELNDILQTLLQELQGKMPNEVADAYNFPAGLTGKGQSVALVELGGGIDMQNEAAYYRDHGFNMPDIRVKSVDGAIPQTGLGGNSDREVSMDSQIVGTVAPDAKQSIIFAPNTHRGFLDAVAAATFPAENESQNNAISISWVSPIESWSAAERQDMGYMFKAAALKGISVFAATGDFGASPDGRTGVYYPAADPFVTATGGTSASFQNGRITNESVWNANDGSTGGGYSIDPVPEYQQSVYGGQLSGRAIPDISGLAQGYRIRVAGVEAASGGTSAAAPLMASLAVRLNEGLGRPIGFMNPFLYKHGMAGIGFFFNDITSGGNGYQGSPGYIAAPGWDPATGWGSLDGSKLLQAYQSDPGAFTDTTNTVLSMIRSQPLQAGVANYM